MLIKPPPHMCYHVKFDDQPHPSQGDLVFAVARCLSVRLCLSCSYPDA